MSSVVRERMSRGYGVSVAELLACAVTRDQGDLDDNLPLARALVKEYGPDRLLELDRATLREQFGLDEYEIDRFLAAMELGRKLADHRSGDKPEALTPREAFKIFEELGDHKQEHFEAASFNAKGVLIRKYPVHVGTVDRSLVSPRDVYREAVRDGAASVIVAHNHPSGDPEPSEQDIQTTRALKRAGESLDIPLIDHLIIVRDGYLSFLNKGLL